MHYKHKQIGVTYLNNVINYINLDNASRIIKLIIIAITTSSYGAEGAP